MFCVTYHTTVWAPKQWQLTKIETVTSFQSWKQNFIFTLSLDDKFTPYLTDGTTWLKKTAANPNRGFTNDDGNGGLTAT